ncbi:hypothetical protein FTUN_8163 [Frigoriglobus tundricola]|uniref:Uncharacterized protein n=1 Tax=Frigoriglobus tundricola TaxID=2774151 RepID=A0A6M5Z5J3_9BACT|nr:hypothetical protein FTUN_8163 [Frigoriglobus tundricola]
MRLGPRRSDPTRFQNGTSKNGRNCNGLLGSQFGPFRGSDVFSLSSAARKNCATSGPDVVSPARFTSGTRCDGNQCTSNRYMSDSKSIPLGRMRDPIGIKARPCD